MRTRYMSYVALGLMANLVWAPSVSHQLAYALPPQVAAPQPHDTLSDLARIEATQRGAFEKLFANPYRGFTRSMLVVDEEIAEPADPIVVYTGRRTSDPNSEGFEFALSRSFEYTPLPDHGVNAKVHFVEGVATGLEQIKFRGMTVQLDHPNTPQRLRGLMILDWAPISVPFFPNCEDTAAYLACRETAKSKLVACKEKAWNDFKADVIGDAALGALLGGFITCVVGALKGGAAISWQALLGACAAGAVIGGIIGVFRAYVKYRAKLNGCKVDYDVAMIECWNKFCATVEGGASHMKEYNPVP